MNDLFVSPSLKQYVGLSPKLMQYMDVLQMDTQALLEYINNIAETNPTLEIEEKIFPWVDDRKTRYLSASHIYDDRSTFMHDTLDFDPLEMLGEYDKCFESLSAFVKDQLERLELPDRVSVLAVYIAEMLDDNGYLDQEDLDELHNYHVGEAELSEAISAIQSLEPAGIGARNLSECLIIQLRRLPEDNLLELEIVANHLELLAKKRFDKIARLLDTTEADVICAAARISKLEPRPGSLFSAGEPTLYIEPDLFVEEKQGQFVLSINEHELPIVQVCSEYARMAVETENREAQDYLRDKIKETKWLMNCLERRKTTMLLCGRAIVELQQKFFKTGGQHLDPVCLADVAEHTDLHISTVSRAIKGKYLQCPQGIFPVSFFLEHSSSKTQGTSSAYSTKLLLKNIVDKEPKSSPYSDQRLADLLYQQGIKLARRTVTKYRESLGIPSSAERCI